MTDSGSVFLGLHFVSAQFAEQVGAVAVFAGTLYQFLSYAAEVRQFHADNLSGRDAQLEQFFAERTRSLHWWNWRRRRTALWEVSVAANAGIAPAIRRQEEIYERNAIGWAMLVVGSGLLAIAAILG